MGRCGGAARGVESLSGSLMPEAGCRSRRWRTGVVDRRLGRCDRHVDKARLAKGWRLNLHHAPASQPWNSEIAPRSAAPQPAPTTAPALSKPHAPRPPQTKRRAETSPLRQMGEPAGSCGPKYATPKNHAGENPVTGSVKVRQSQAGVPLSQYHLRAITIGSAASPSSTSNTVAGNAAPCPQHPASQTRHAPNR